MSDQLADLPLQFQWHLVVKNGNMTFLLLELILADQLTDLPLLFIPSILGMADSASKASWDVYYGMYFTGIVDSSEKDGNLLLFLNN